MHACIAKRNRKCRKLYIYINYSKLQVMPTVANVFVWISLKNCKKKIILCLAICFRLPMEDCSKMTEATETETEGKLEYKLLFDIWLWSPIICVILDMEMQCRNLIQMVCKSNNFILNVFMKRCLVLLKKRRLFGEKCYWRTFFYHL